MKNKKGLILIFTVAIIALMLVVTACNAIDSDVESSESNTEGTSELVETIHEHSWTAATCTAPETCSACGATNGSAAEHSWTAATCSSPKTCSKCGTTSGSAAGHSWQAATCTAPETCSACGATNGSAAEHSWTAATCTAPETCSKCGATNGSALGHTWEGDICSVCSQKNIKLYSDTDAPDFGCVFDTYKEPYYTSNSESGACYMYLVPGATDINGAAEYVEEYEALLSACGYTEYPSATDGTTSKMYLKTLGGGVMVTVSTDMIMITVTSISY